MKAFYFTVALLVSVGASSQINRSYDLEPYSTLRIGGPYKVTLQEGSQPYIEMSGDKEVIEKTTVKIQGRELLVRYENDWGGWKGSQDRVEITITFQELKGLDISGACKLTATDKIATEFLDIEVSGASTIEIGVDTNEVAGDISGASTVNIFGKTTRQRIDLSGASSYKARDLESKRTIVESSGASSATVNASEEIKAEATGASSIYYYGNPSIVDTNSSGAGSVRRRG